MSVYRSAKALRHPKAKKTRVVWDYIEAILDAAVEMDTVARTGVSAPHGLCSTRAVLYVDRIRRPLWRRRGRKINEGRMLGHVPECYRGLDLSA